ncbi:MAG: 3-oxoacyl-[acyl-carrier-protein] reductase [Firmicutes bacterium]|nr:3-oxoacyl-[acyl-carrier-protein] reductase [Bacillota bacterium]
MRLDGKVAIVTGASRGIGREIAVQLAGQGASVVINYTKNKEAAEETLTAVKAAGGRGIIVQADVKNLSACENMVKSALEIYNKVDILVNNAGITRDNLTLRMKPAEWQEVIDTNLTGAFNCVKAVLRPLLKQKSGGRIINIASVVGLAGNIGQANYAAAKAGLIGMTKTLARELAGRQITVNAVAPGFIATEMTAVLTPEIKENLQRQIPLGRMGTTKDVAYLVAFLASEQAAYITGQVIAVDGGMTMQ